MGTQLTSTPTPGSNGHKLCYVLHKACGIRSLDLGYHIPTTSFDKRNPGLPNDEGSHDTLSGLWFQVCIVTVIMTA